MLRIHKPFGYLIEMSRVTSKANFKLDAISADRNRHTLQ